MTVFLELFRPRKPSLLVGVIMNRKSVRRNSFKAFKASYFKNIIVAFIVIVILDGGYLYSTKKMAQGGVEPPTPRFSVLCSTS